MLNFFAKMIRKMFGTQNERQLEKLLPVVAEVNTFEEKISVMTSESIKLRVIEVKKEIKVDMESISSEVENIREQITSATSETERNKHKDRLKKLRNQPVAKFLPEVFAIVREASKRTIGLRHFDVQLMGGLVLHNGEISEMTTGEGKTLVATLPSALNAIAGEKVHVITVNDYLAKRDSEWMSPVFNFLGLSVGVLQNDMEHKDKKEAYSCDILYGTNNEFGFDYLRDNMVSDINDTVQQQLGFAVVDEVDSILIDEARTPLIISGPVDETNEAYEQMRPIVSEVVSTQRKLVGDYLREFKSKMETDKKESAGELLYLIHKADPKNPELMSITLNDNKAKTLLDKTQSVMDSKVMEKDKSLLLENLFFIYDEKTREATFSARGQKLMLEKFNIEFMLEDIEAKIAELADEDIPENEKTEKETELVTEYSIQQKTVESIKQLLKAYILFQKDVDYVVKDNKIVIVDSFTGRMMPGRRFSDGIHEAIEAKERVEVQRESQTLATVTLQNFFRMYDKLSGMTGTAKTEEAEFENIYLLPVIQIPTNRELKRKNLSDRIYKTEREKFNAVVEEIARLNEKGAPLLVGTISIEKSEKLSRLLTDKGVKHNVLNAKYHEKEAHIIAQAGRYKGVTIATNMAGRGTDIVLGGNPEDLARVKVESLNIEGEDEIKQALNNFLEEAKVKVEQEKQKVVAAGGLHVLGTERHEARRIDDQLRGRCGRQGDPGASRFYLSLEDDLMRVFGSDRIKMVMDKLGMEEGEVIENPLVTRAVRTAQHRVESQNFEIRKHLLKYDDVMNQQREVIYRRRRRVLEGIDLKEEFFECLTVGLETLLEHWNDTPDPETFCKSVLYRYAVNVKQENIESLNAYEVIDHVIEATKKGYSAREVFLGKDRMRELEKMVMLGVIDSNWKEYLREIDELREGISWRAYAQKDPLVEFQHEAFNLFSGLMMKIDEETAERIMKLSAMEEHYKQKVFEPGKETFEHKQYSALGASSAGQDAVYGQGSGPVESGSEVFKKATHKKDESFKREAPKVGRNDPCSCGSGKKYKKCCGK